MTTNSNGGGSAADSAAAGGTDEGGVVRVVLYDADASSEGKLRELLESVQGVRVVETLTGTADLTPVIAKTAADLVIANLDPDGQKIMSAVSAAAQSHPGLTFFAVSARSDVALVKASMRSGFSEFLQLPEELAQLGEAITTLRRSENDGSVGQIITVLGSSGGVGCTTVAVNLAVELAEKSGREVALVDLNFLFGHVAMMLDLDIQHSVADLCGESTTLDERVLQKAVTKHKSNVHVVPRPREFEETEGLSAESCVPMITILRQMYPYVVLDGPTNSDATALTLLDVADWNLLVVQPLVTSARNAKRILNALHKQGFKGQPLKAICNRAGGGLSHLSTQRLEKSLGTKIELCIPDDWTSVSAAINLGEPLAVNAPKSKAREAIRELADMIRGGGGEEAERSSGLLARLFNK